MTVPLGNDGQGNPIELPDAAASWRVRRMTGRPGPHQVVYDKRTGDTLLLDIAATADDMRAAGCEAGRYRLEACDADGKPLGVVAFTEIGPAEAVAPSTAPTEPRLSTETIGLLREAIATLRTSNEKLADSMARGFEAMAGAFGPVRAAPALVPEHVEPIDVQAQAAPERTDYMPQILTLANQLLPLLPSLFQALKGGAAAPAAETPQTPPTEGAP